MIKPVDQVKESLSKYYHTTETCKGTGWEYWDDRMDTIAHHIVQKQPTAWPLLCELANSPFLKRYALNEKPELTLSYDPETGEPHFDVMVRFKGVTFDAKKKNIDLLDSKLWSEKSDKLRWRLAKAEILIIPKF